MPMVKVRGSQWLYIVRSGTWRLRHHDVQDTICYSLRHRYARVVGPLHAAQGCVEVPQGRTPVVGTAMDRQISSWGSVAPKASKTPLTELELLTSEVTWTLWGTSRVLRTWLTSKSDVLNIYLMYVSVRGQKLVHEVCMYVLSVGPIHYATWLGGYEAIQHAILDGRKLAKLVWQAWEAKYSCFNVLQIYMHITIHKCDLYTSMLTTKAARRHARGIMAYIYTMGSWSGVAWRAGSVLLAYLEYTCVIVT